MSFKVGDIVIGQNHVNDIEMNGAEGEVIGGLKVRPTVGRTSRIRRVEAVYMVRWANGEKMGALPATLRKKNPPQETSTWEAVQAHTGWNPQKITEGL